MRKVIVVLPVFDEEMALPSLLGKIKDLAGELEERVVVAAVDDGSRDASPEIIGKFAGEIEVIRVTHAENQGLRRTMYDGYVAAARMALDDDVIVTMDADDTQDPKYIQGMIRKLDEGSDVVIASRYQGGSVVRGVPARRRLCSLGANLLCRAFLRLKNVRDYACGFRAFRGALLKKCVERYGNDLLEIKGYGFICAVEVLLKAAACGAVFDEVPFELRYDRRGEGSKMRAGRTALGYLVLVWRSMALKAGGRG